LLLVNITTKLYKGFGDMEIMREKLMDIQDSSKTYIPTIKDWERA